MAEQVSEGFGVRPTRAQVPDLSLASSYLSLTSLTCGVEISTVFPCEVILKIQ